MKSIELKMSVIPAGLTTDCEVTELNCPVNEMGEAEFTSLRGLVRSKLGGADPEHVRVFWQGQYLDMFVDDDGVTKNLPINARATAIYWNNVKVHAPAEYDPDSMPFIHGTAVLFDKRVWY